MSWTDEEVAELRRLREEEGLSFAEIGKRIGKTKSACVGRYARGAESRDWTGTVTPSSAPPRPYTPDEAKLMTEMVEAGATVRMIAAELDRFTSSVTAKLQNMKLKAAKQRRPKAERPHAPTTVKIRKPAAPLPRPVSPPTIKGEAHGGVHIAEVGPGQCRWINGDPAHGMCCGAATVPGTSWCSEHHERVYPHERQRELNQEKTAFVERILARKEAA